MIKKISLDLKDIDSTIKNLKVASKEMKKLPNEICQEVAEIGADYAQSLFDNTHTDQTIDISTIHTSVENSTNGYNIVARGEEVLYAEFGTGENGADDGHPAKWDFQLNPYNSGPYVRQLVNSKTGRHFWWYMGYSEGNASGKQMFDTGNYLKNKVIKDVSKKKVGEVLSKV